MPDNKQYIMREKVEKKLGTHCPFIHLYTIVFLFILYIYIINNVHAYYIICNNM